LIEEETMLDYNDRPSSTTTMGYNFPMINAIHVTNLDFDGYYEMCIIEENFLQDQDIN
jgi:hypothetical protein